MAASIGGSGEIDQALSKRWLRARRLWTRVRETFPVTALGLCVGAFAAYVLTTYAFGSQDLVLLVVGGLGLLLLLSALSCVLLATLWCGLRLRRGGGGGTPSQSAVLLETGEPTTLSTPLPALTWFPLLDVRLDWPAPLSTRVDVVRQDGFTCERVTLAHRGEHARIVRRVTLSDVFGLCAVSLRWTDKQALSVLPRLGGLRYAPDLVARSAGDALSHPLGLDEGDRVELRRYAPGSPARFIHWKVYARSRKLMVRMPERALSVARRIALFVIAAEDDDASAGVARFLLQRKLLGDDFEVGTDLEVCPPSDLDAALHAVLRCAKVSAAQAGVGFAQFAERVERQGPASFVLVVPPTPGPWLMHIAAAAKRRRLSVLIGTDAVVDALAKPRWMHWFWQAAPQAGNARAALNEVMTTLAKQNVHVRALDRVSGKLVLNTAARAPERAHAATLEPT